MRILEILMLAGLFGLAGLYGLAPNQRFGWFPWQTIQTASGMDSVISRKVKAVDRKITKNSARRSIAPFLTGSSKAGAQECRYENPGLPDSNVAAGLCSRLDLNLEISEIVRSSPRVPDSEKLSIGATRSEVRKRNGTPTLEVAGMRDGSFVERYYYATPDHAHVEIATLRNGKLVSTETAGF